MSAISVEAQKLAPDAIINLFTLDTTIIGGPIFSFVQGSEHNGFVSYGGVEYTPVDIEFEGLETSGAGALPTPRVRVANNDGFAQQIINTWGDLLNCSFHRVRTYARFLDGHEEPDPTAYYGPDTFRVERRVSENSQFIEWELSAAIDQEGKQIPGRQVIRDTCLWRYRAFNHSSGQFDYSRAQCPYTGASYFDINDEPVTDPAKDVPSRRLGCCRARFGAANPLPFGGFPGVARTD